MNETRDLAKWIVGLKWGDIPEDVINYAKVLTFRRFGVYVRRIYSGQQQSSSSVCEIYGRYTGVDGGQLW